MVSTKHCCWGQCKSDSRYPEKLQKSLKEMQMLGLKVFIPFPKPSQGLERCQRWVKACCRKNFSIENITRNTYICALHWPGEKGPTEEFPDPLKANLMSNEVNKASRAKRKASQQNGGKKRKKELDILPEYPTSTEEDSLSKIEFPGHIRDSRSQVDNLTNFSKATTHTEFLKYELSSNEGNVELSEAPPNMAKEYEALLTPQAVQFLAEMVKNFDFQVSEILRSRQFKKLYYQQTNILPDFLKKSSAHELWQMKEIPKRLQDRRIDLGDITPANTELFKMALNSSACGIQTDLDDGHCPTWANQIKGLFNVYQFVHGNMTDVPQMSSAPLVILRPRAWNMMERNMMVDGKVIPGALFDFGLHIFHNGKTMLHNGDGPFLYLPKLESHLEARLWNEIFSWAESRLGLPLGCIKACVLIESIFTSFELEQVLFELRDHCAGLNCGMWDYSASFISTFGHSKDFILADRKKYVSMDEQYLKNYLELVIKTCHAHGCYATGGMVPAVLPKNCPTKSLIIQNVCRAKLKEIQAGVDGFLVFDPGLIQPLLEVWRQNVLSENQLHVHRQDVQVNAMDLLTLPKGGFTLAGLVNNITVSILFIQAWLRGVGSFVLNGAVEDSATAEISRSQIWQAIRHQCVLENDGRKITRAFVKNQIEIIRDQLIKIHASSPCNEEQLNISAQLLEQLILARDFPQFITTYLYEEHAFIQSKWQSSPE